MTARNVCIDAVTAELRAVGITYEIAHGGKHPQVHFSINGMRRFYTIRLARSAECSRGGSKVAAEGSATRAGAYDASQRHCGAGEEKVAAAKL